MTGALDLSGHLWHGSDSCIFFSSARGEPPYIHVTRERSVAICWRELVSLVIR
jgi:hypothetical protein